MATQTTKVGVWATLVGVLLVGAALRFGLLGADVRFHPDEAFFAAFARDAAVRGEWWLPGDLDKTPLAIYGQALAMLLVGIRWDGEVWRLAPLQGEFAARLVSVYASVWVIPLAYQLALAVGARRRAAVLAAALMAASPYGVAFGAVAFTDTPMLAGVLLACLLAARHYGAWAAASLVLAVAAKQQAVLFLPLVVVLLNRAAWGRFLLVLLLGGVGLFAWDLLRPFSSVWVLGAANNTPDLQTGPGLGARLRAWWPLVRLSFGAWGTPVLLALGLAGAWRVPVPWRVGALAGYGLAYAGLHGLAPLNVYDRYWLPMIPLLAVGLGWALAQRQWTYRLGWAALLLALPGAMLASQGHPQLGGDAGQHTGIIPLADYLNDREFGAIIYDRWLGWELNYYLGAWSDKRRAYYPTPLHMITDPALYLPDPAPRYLPVPQHAQAGAWWLALRVVGFRVCVGYESPPFQVWVLTRPGLGLGAAPSAGGWGPGACPGLAMAPPDARIVAASMPGSVASR